MADSSDKSSLKDKHSLTVVSIVAIVAVVGILLSVFGTNRESITNLTGYAVKPLTVDIGSSSIILQVSTASGTATIAETKGVVNLKLSGLPVDPVTSLSIPITMTDTSTRPATVGDVNSYHAWLLRLRKDDDNKYIFDKGLYLGKVEVSKKGVLRKLPDFGENRIRVASGKLKVNLKSDLTADEYNLIAVTANPTEDVGEEWTESNAGNAFTLRGSNGAIVLWGALDELP